LFFGVFVPGEEDDNCVCFINYYAMKPIDNRTDADLPSCLPWFTHTDDLQFWPHAEELGTLRFCDSALIQPFMDVHNVMLHMTTICTVAGTQSIFQLYGDWGGAIWNPSGTQEKRKHFDLCPASGRLCVMTRDNEVRVVDYLEPI
jgi:hypothetical protein